MTNQPTNQPTNEPTNQEPSRHQGLFLTCEPKWKVLPPLGGKQKKALTHSKGGEDHLFNYHQRDFPHHHLCDTKKSFDTFKRKECNDMPSYITWCNKKNVIRSLGSSLGKMLGPMLTVMEGMVRIFLALQCIVSAQKFGILHKA